MGECLNVIIFRINPTILKYIPHRHRATYLNPHDLRSSTPTPYVPQRLAARTCLEVPFTTFGGSIRHVWRLHSLHLEAPFITFGGSIYYVWRLQTRLSQSLRPCLMLFLRKNFMHYTGNSVNKDRFMSQSPFHYKKWCIPSLQRL